VTLEHAQRPQEMRRLAAPATANLEVLAVDVLMRIDGARPGVGIVAGHDVPAAITRQRQPFLDRASRACRFDYDVDPFAVRQRLDRFQPLTGRQGRHIVNVVRAHRARKIEPRGRRADCDDRRGAAESSERNRAQADRAGSLDEDGVGRTQLGPLEDVHGGLQPAAAADVVIEADGVGQPRDGDPGLEIDRLRPAAEQAFGRRIGDAVDAA
jgi:hypothetical protein